MTSTSSDRRTMHGRRDVSRLLAAAQFGALLLLGANVAAATTFTIEARDAAGAPLQDVVVVLDPLAPEAKRVPPRAAIDQVAKQFVPRVTVLQTGTVVTFPNSDRIRHQVYSFSEPKRFDLKLYAGTEAPPITFDAPGLVVLGCNIHDTMVGFVVVVDTPHFTKSAADGRATLDVPAGRYRLRVWHPQFTREVAPREVAIAADGSVLKLALETTPSPTTLATWPD